MGVVSKNAPTGAKFQVIETIRSPAVELLKNWNALEVLYVLPLMMSPDATTAA
jgi:hypothetical protein